MVESQLIVGGVSPYHILIVINNLTTSYPPLEFLDFCFTITYFRFSAPVCILLAEIGYSRNEDGVFGQL